MNPLLRFFPKIRQHPLSYRLLAYVVLCSSLFALLATATQLYMDYRRDVSDLYESLSFIKKSYLHPIAASTFKIDTDHLRLELEGALKLPDIVYLEVQELRGNQIHTFSKGNPNVAKMIRKEFPLEFVSPSGKKRLMGTLIVIASLEGVYQRLWSRVITILATNMVKTFLASACILAIIYLLITRRLTRLADYTQQLVPGVTNHRLTLNRRSSQTDVVDELEQVVKAINNLQDRSSQDIAMLKKQELEIQDRLEFEEFIAQFSTELINVSSDQLDLKIHEVLTRIGAYMHVDRSYLFQFNREKTEFRISHLWEAEDIPVDQVVRGAIVREQFPWLAENLLSNRDIVISDVEELAFEEATSEYKFCRDMGIQAFLILPIEVEDAPVCAIGLDLIGTKREWPEELKGRLRLIGQNLGNAIARSYAELTLQETYKQIEGLKDRLEAETTYLQQEIKQEHNFENIIGHSQALKYVLYRVEQVSSTDSPVIVLGETGVGKELVARAIHKLSPRSKRALVKVNCAALPVNLVESELFGHEKGAFTGATMRQLGRFELASGSTLFLDEIGEMPMETQAKLLRVLESGEFERVGNPKTLHSDARIVASTNRDLEKAVRRGEFRQDLWYRLKVFPITVPPLRERKEDIPLLVTWFIEQLSRKLGKPGIDISKEGMRALQDYLWPGNVRELKHMIEVALITAQDKKLKFEFPETSQMEISIIKPLEEMERDYILQVLKTKEWKIGGADGVASALGMHPNTLRSRIKKLGIKKPSPDQKAQ